MPVETKSVTVLSIPLEELYVPDWNPRKIIERSALVSLIEFMRLGGPIPRIVVLRGQEKGLWAIIEGQMRFLAAQSLGWTHLDAEEFEGTLEQAKDRANTSNNHNPPYWLDKYEGWNSRFKDHPEWDSQAKKATGLGISDDWVNRCVNLLDVLNEASRKLIRESKGGIGIKTGLNLSDKDISPEQFGNNMNDDNYSGFENRTDWELTERVAFELTRLLPNRVLEPAQRVPIQDQAFKILQTVIARRMTSAQVAAHVKSVKAGNDPARVEDKAFATPVPNFQGEGRGLIAPGSKKEPGEVSVFWGTMAGIPWIKAIRAKIKASQDPTLWEKLFLVAAFFGRILHWTWHKIWPLTKKSIGWVGRLLKKALNGTLRFLGEMVGKPAKKIAQGVVGIALVVGLAYGLYLFFFHPAGIRGLLGRATSGVIHWVGSWVNPWDGDNKSIPQPLPTTIPTPGTSNPTQRHEDTKEGANVGSSETQNPTTARKTPNSSLPPGPKPQDEGRGLGGPDHSGSGLTPNSPAATPNGEAALRGSKSRSKGSLLQSSVVAPASSSSSVLQSAPGAPATGEEAAWVAELIPAFPPPFLVKPLDIQPDPTISPLMVQKRLYEIQDPERIRVYVGHDRQGVKSMNVDDGGMDLFFNGSFGGLLGDSSSFRFFWEDVQGIRLATVEVSGDKPQTLCFCALEVKTKKKMAAFECEPGDMTHLVSALAAQFKSSTKRELSVAPLPYLNQGLWLGEQNQVDGLWNESPAGRSQEVKLHYSLTDWKRPSTGGGIHLGDYLWGLGVNKDEQTRKEVLLRQLGGAASGPATLFVVGPFDWRKAQEAATGSGNDPFNPPRRAVRLVAP